MCSAQAHVCFTPESDIKCDIVECPLWAKSGHVTLIFEHVETRSDERPLCLYMGLWTVRCGSLVCRPLVCKTAPDLSRSLLGSKTHRHGEWLSHHRPSTSPHMRACYQTALASQHRLAGELPVSVDFC